MMEIVRIFSLIIQGMVALILIFPVLSGIIYLFIPRKKLKKIIEEEGDYAIIVTAYKYTGNLSNVVDSLLKMNYRNYVVYIVADDCADYQPDFNDERVVVLKPAIPFANQVKSHFYAIENFKRKHNRVTIIDSDNLVHPDYLKELDPFFSAGYKAVQGVRAAKNYDNTYSKLDAINELYYLFCDRKVLFGIGSSCMLSGSGMAFTTTLYKECLGDLKTSGAGFDKVLQMRIVSKKNTIAFAEKSIVYDEKTSSTDQLVKQRARWINTWFRFFSFGLQLIKKGIFNFNLNQFLFGFVLVRPPLFMLVMLLGILFLANVFLNPVLALIWIALMLIFIAGFLFALKIMKAPKILYQALLHIPAFMFYQVLSLLKAKKANQLSVATVHQHHKKVEEVK